MPDHFLLLKIHPHCHINPHKISAIFQVPLDTHTELVVDGVRISVEAPLDHVLDVLGQNGFFTGQTEVEN